MRQSLQYESPSRIAWFAIGLAAGAAAVGAALLTAARLRSLSTPASRAPQPIPADQFALSDRIGQEMIREAIARDELAVSDGMMAEIEELDLDDGWTTIS